MSEPPADVVRFLQSKVLDLWPRVVGSLSFHRSRRGHENCPPCFYPHEAPYDPVIVVAHAIGCSTHRSASLAVAFFD